MFEEKHQNSKIQKKVILLGLDNSNFKDSIFDVLCLDVL